MGIRWDILYMFSYIQPHLFFNQSLTSELSRVKHTIRQIIIPVQPIPAEPLNVHLRNPLKQGLIH